MFRSPQKLRSGTKGKPVLLSTSDKGKPTLHRSLSVPEPSSSPPATTMPTDTIKDNISVDPLSVEKCVNNYLSGEKVVDLLVTRLEASLKNIVEAAVQTALTAANKEIKQLRDELSHLAERVGELEGRVVDRTDDLEQYQRRTNLRFFGIDETAGENTDEIVASLCREKLGVDVPISAICRSHRVGKQPRPAADGKTVSRPIIVRYVSYRDRQRVFEAKKKLKGSGVTIREDLTPRRAELFRRVAAAHGPRNTWTLDGRVHWVDQHGNRGTATRPADLDTHLGH